MLDRILNRVARSKARQQHHFPHVEEAEIRILLSTIPVVSSPLAPAPRSMSQSDLGTVGFNASTGEWKADRFDGTGYVVETLTDWDSSIQDVPTAFGDLWGNGLLDVVRYDPNTGNLNADWQSGSAISSGIISGWYSGAELSNFSVRDMNGDGRGDIVAFDRKTGNWVASMSLPGFGYSAAVIGTWDKFSEWKFVSLADFDADGRIDIAGYSAFQSTWQILFGSSSNRFESLTVPRTSPGSTAGKGLVAEFNGLSGADILEWDSTSGNWNAISFPGRTYQKTLVGQWRTTGNWVDVISADFWGTGRQAIIGRDEITDEWWVTWSVGSGYSTRLLAKWGSASYSNVTIADYNGDGRMELIARNSSTGYWYQLYSSAGGIVRTINVAATDPRWTYDNVQVASLTEDSLPDVLLHRTGTSSWDFLASRAPLGFNVSSFDPGIPGFRPRDLAVGDLDLDGKIDLLSRDAGSNNWLKVTFNSGKLQAKPWNRWNAYGNSWYATTTIDFDGDGDNDLAGFDLQTGDWWLTNFEGTTTTTTKIANWNPAHSWKFINTIDFDGNGTVDLVGWDSTSGEWMWVRGENGVVLSSSIGVWSATNSWSDVVIADMFGTGISGIYGRNNAGQWWGTWKTSNGTSTRYLSGFNPSGNYSDTMVIDFNGDRRQAVATRDLKTGNWYAIQFVGNNFQQSLLSTWSPKSVWDSILKGDTDGNGKESIYGRNQSTGAFVEIYSTGTGFAQKSVGTLLSGVSIDLSVTADLTGTGRDQLYLRAPAMNTWLQIQQSSTGTYGLRYLGKFDVSQNWTSVSVGDLNQDGIDDFAGYIGQGKWSWISVQDGNWTSGWMDAWSTDVVWSNVGLTEVPGVSNQSLKASILKATPGLKGALASGDILTSSTLIGNWIANSVDYAMYNELLSNAPSSLADAYLVGFAQDLVGASCGGYGYLTAATLQLFGIDAFVVNIGQLAEDLTHTFAVVPIRRGTSFDYFILDTTVNASIRKSSDGSMATYFDAVNTSLSGQFDQLYIEQGSVQNRDFISTSDRSWIPGVTLEGRSVNGAYVHRWSSYGLDDYLASIDPTLAKYGYQTGYAGYLQLMRKVISVDPIAGSSPQCDTARSSFWAELTARGLLQS